MNKVLIFLLSAIIFLAPTNLFLNLTEQFSYVSGLRVDYLIPKLYLSQIFVVAFVLMTLFKAISNRSLKPAAILTPLRRQPWLSGLLLISAVAIAANTIWQAPLTGSWQLGNLLLIWTLMLSAKTLLQPNKPTKTIPTAIFLALIITVIFQSLIGIYQFVQQTAVYGYNLLGEPNISSYIGLAKTTLQGKELVLPYGTTAHPNLLGGFLAIYLLTIWLAVFSAKTNPIWKSLLAGLASIVGTITLALTFSISSWLVLGLGLIAFLLKQKKVLLSLAAAIFIAAPIVIYFCAANGLSLPLMEQNSLLRRSYLNTAALRMGGSNLLAGVGLNSFTRYVEQYSPEREVVRFVQPAHHGGLLWLAETGLAGIIFSIALFFLLKQHNQGNRILLAAIVLTPALALDHYLLTLFPGMLLFVMAALLTAGQLNLRHLHRRRLNQKERE